MKNNIHGFTDNNLLSVKPCMLFFIHNLPRILCAGTISLVSFLDLFWPITGVTNPIMKSFFPSELYQSHSNQWSMYECCLSAGPYHSQLCQWLCLPPTTCCIKIRYFTSTTLDWCTFWPLWKCSIRQNLYSLSCSRKHGIFLGTIYPFIHLRTQVNVSHNYH